MGAVWLRVRGDLRHRWKQVLALAVVVGLSGAVVIASVAGARRTETAYPRLLEQSRAYDMEVSVNGPDATVLDRVAKLPEVAQSGKIAVIPADEPRAGGLFRWDVQAGAVLDVAVGRRFEKVRVVAGRSADPSRPGEANASEAFLQQRKLRVGDAFSFQPVSFEELFRFFGGAPIRPTLPARTVRIVGAWRLPHDVAFGEDAKGLLYLTPAWAEEFGDQVAMLPVMYVRLHRGAADVPVFTRKAEQIAGGPGVLAFHGRAELARTVERAVGLQVSALYAFALLGAIASVLIAGQAISRFVALGASDDHVLSALGMSPSSRVAVAVGTTATIAVIGSVVAVLVAVVASPLFPMGFTAPLEPRPGIRVDVLAILAGALLVVLAVVLRATLAAAAGLRRAQGQRGRTRTGGVAEVAARMSMPASAVSGIRLATVRGQRDRALPLMATLSSVTIGIAAVVAAVVFGKSFDGLLASPAAYGWAWDLLIAGGEDPGVVADKAASLTASEDVEHLAMLRVARARVVNRDQPVFAFDPLKGAPRLTLSRGRLPVRDDEIALGSATLREAGVDIGERLALRATPRACAPAPSCNLELRVTGVVVAPALEDNSPDSGAIVTVGAAQRLATSEGYTNLIVWLRDGATEASLKPLLDEQAEDPRIAVAGIEIENLARVRQMPFALAALLAALAGATLVHLLVTSVRRRRRDLAVLKTLGFSKSQVKAAVAWQATTIAVAGLALGVPGGVIAGRAAWSVMRSDLGVASEPAVPLLALATGVGATLLLANIVAALPGRRAAALQPASILRAE